MSITRRSFTPGSLMLDTDGRPIHAHGGGLRYENGIYYWYGENKEFTNGKNGIWTWGISCYSSTDLYQWKNEGLIIPPEQYDRSSSLHPSRPIDRPHILYCADTGKYVCWLKLSGKDACFTVLTADKLLGPYTIVRDRLRPFGMAIGDFDVWQDGNGAGYIFFEHDHNGLIAARLTADFTDVAEPYRDNYSNLKPPHTREGVTHFVHAGKHYLLTSGMTGYIPNKSQVAVSDDPLGPYIPICDPHRNDESASSFNSQVSAILLHPDNPNLYITLADRWIPNLMLTGEKSAKIARGQDALEKRKILSHLPELLYMARLPWDCSKVNTSLSRYVWLPMRFENDLPVIDWYEEWRLEDFIAERKRG